MWPTCVYSLFVPSGSGLCRICGYPCVTPQLRGSRADASLVRPARFRRPPQRRLRHSHEAATRAAPEAKAWVSAYQAEARPSGRVQWGTQETAWVPCPSSPGRSQEMVVLVPVWARTGEGGHLRSWEVQVAPRVFQNAELHGGL